MNQSFRGVFFDRKAKVLSKIERKKIAFQFILTSVCSALLGLLLVRALSESVYFDNILLVSTHFEKIFIDCKGFYDYFFCILSYALSDIICVLIVFAVSFAVFNYVVSDFVLIYSGVRFGLIISFLYSFVSNAGYTYNIGWVRYLVFIFFKAAVFILLLDYSYRAAVYSVNLKKISAAGRPNLKFKVLLPFLVNTFARIGGVIILNGLYCALIYFLK